MEYILSTEALSKQYKNFKALNGLTMHVEKGAIYGFVGRNGAGKTTLIRLICGAAAAHFRNLYALWDKEYSKEIQEARRRMGSGGRNPISLSGHDCGGKPP